MVLRGMCLSSAGYMADSASGPSSSPAENDVDEANDPWRKLLKDVRGAGKAEVDEDEDENGDEDEDDPDCKCSHAQHRCHELTASVTDNRGELCMVCGPF